LIRLQLFVTNLAEPAPAIEAWPSARNGLPLPLSAIEVDWLPVPGARILADIWVHAPSGTQRKGPGFPGPSVSSALRLRDYQKRQTSDEVMVCS
jgi:hypothetical protein